MTKDNILINLLISNEIGNKLNLSLNKMNLYNFDTFLIVLLLHSAITYSLLGFLFLLCHSIELYNNFYLPVLSCKPLPINIIIDYFLI